MSESPFVNPDPRRVFYTSDLVLGLWDAFPVSPGHALIVPRRVVATWFDATREEQIALLDGIEAAKQAVERERKPDGYNIGINAGEAAGQTVFHLHVHVIPRYRGDVDDPRGGVRHVIPSKANYLLTSPGDGASLARESLAAAPGRLVHQQLLPELSRDLDQARSVRFAVAFLLRSGWTMIADRLWDLLVQRKGSATILTGDYLDVSDPDALQQLLDLSADPDVEGRLDARVFGATRAGRSFHPKAYLFVSAGGQAAAYVGSSNLSQPALTTGVEWNYRLSEVPRDVEEGFDRLLKDPATVVLTQEWLEDYRRRRRPPSTPQPVEVVTEAIVAPPTPHGIQREALEALRQTREAGNGAGLVVLATGLGKTWLAAFDSVHFSRVLFVAHREEILSQAHRTFRTIRPQARLGFFTGKEKDGQADVLFAGVQTLANHYRSFAADAFDYIVVDEFHHACAASYRKILDYFTPEFLLAITATPERTDGGDLLSLCAENVVYRCELARGINDRLLCPVRYYGVPDTVDYAQIPWRNRKFDPEELTAAVATQTRAENAWEQHKKYGGLRTVGFCCSQRHADFMRDFFRKRGLRAASVHTGASSDHRSESLEKLKSGELDVIFSVDVFNEGMDLPEIDTVMMLRPTESRVLWLQQLGRGLRKTDDKKHLVVIDYIGNHRTFLVKLQTLFMELAACSRGSDAELRQLLDQLAKGKLVLPDGCDVTYELETLDILAGLLRTAKAEALTLWLQDFRTRYDRRPTASETFHEGYNPRVVHKDYGSWLNYLRLKGALSDNESALFESHRQFLTTLGTTAMTKSYKMVLLEAMLSRVDITEPIGIDELTAAFIQRARRSRRVAQDVSASLDDFGAVQSLLVRNPINAWTGGKEGAAFFAYEGGVFRCTVRSPDPAGLSDLAREIVEWRLAEYLDRNLLDEGAIQDGFLAKVSQTQGRPILFLDRKRFPNTPEGDQTLWVEGAPYTASFVKIALNKVVKGEERANLLPSFLRGWFGPDAGQPGTMHQVQFTPAETGWAMSPVGVKLDSELVVGHRYAREQIPRFFGLTFSKAIWSSGVGHGGGVIVLLVTMNKETLLADHQYADRFLAPDLFQWQSQNRTTQGSTFGQLLRHHVQKGVDVHLFIRAEKKINGVSQPFRYCGKVEFESWEGEQPITVVWRLTAKLTEELEAALT